MNLYKIFLPSFALSMVLCGCGTGAKTEAMLTASGLDPAKFVTTVDGKETALYTLTNHNGLEACITNYGGRLVSLMVPDSSGKLTDVVLGHDSIADYINIDGNFGALIGRYGNRINHGHFSLDGKEYKLPQNDFGHCLHGGEKGFHHRVWDTYLATDSTLTLKLFSPDGEAGFPGNVSVTVTYALNPDNSLSIDYEATTDAPTVINLTNHSYFNLSGNASNDILSETLWLDSDQFTPIDSTFMTTGEILPTEGTPFDFTVAKSLAEGTNSDDIQIHNGHGYDHNMVLRTGRDANTPAAILTDSTSGIRMEVLTSEPGIQLYAGNFLDGNVAGKHGIRYPRRSAICLETQHYPDSPNKPDWPSVVLRPGDTYHSHCAYRFSLK